MSEGQKDPFSLILGVVSARSRGEIELRGYADALRVLERHFTVFEQRLAVFNTPASFPDGEVLLSAAGQGLDQMRGSVSNLLQLDPLVSNERANSLLEEAKEGYELLLQMHEITKEKQSEFEEVYQELIENS